MGQTDDISDKYATVRRINRQTTRLSYVAVVLSALAIISVLCAPFLLTKRAERRYLREREFSRQWQSNYVSMKASFDKLETHYLICQTNFQALVDALAGQKAIRSK